MTKQYIKLDELEFNIILCALEIGSCDPDETFAENCQQLLENLVKTYTLDSDESTSDDLDDIDLPLHTDQAFKQESSSYDSSDLDSSSEDDYALL